MQFDTPKKARQPTTATHACTSPGLARRAGRRARRWACSPMPDAAALRHRGSMQQKSGPAPTPPGHRSQSRRRQQGQRRRQQGQRRPLPARSARPARDRSAGRSAHWAGSGDRGCRGPFSFGRLARPVRHQGPDPDRRYRGGDHDGRGRDRRRPPPSPARPPNGTSAAASVTNQPELGAPAAEAEADVDVDGEADVGVEG